MVEVIARPALAAVAVPSVAAAVGTLEAAAVVPSVAVAAVGTLSVAATPAAADIAANRKKDSGAITADLPIGSSGDLRIPAHIWAL